MISFNWAALTALFDFNFENFFNHWITKTSKYEAVQAFVDGRNNQNNTCTLGLFNDIIGANKSEL